MGELLALLAPIALIDSTSMLPVAMVPLITILASPRALVTALAFLAGIFVPYLAFCLLVYFGLSEAFQTLTARLAETWKHPDTVDVLFQMVVGLVLLWIGWRMGRPATGTPPRKPMQTEVTPLQAFLFSAGLILVGLPGAVPFFAALDQILQADPPVSGGVIALVFYNLVFLAPLALVVILRMVLGTRVDGLLERVNRMAERWGPRVVRVLLLALGVALMVDGVAWFLGRPLLPV